MHRSMTAGLAVLAALLGTPAVASAQDTGTVSIGPCAVRTSESFGGYTYAYCPVTAKPAAGKPITVHYASSLTRTYQPFPGGAFDRAAGTLSFRGGPQVQNLSFAFKSLTAAQIKRRLKVTLSRATGATITVAVGTPKQIDTIKSTVTLDGGARVQATAVVTYPQRSVRGWWSPATIARVVEDAAAVAPGVSYESQGYTCTPSRAGRGHVCAIQGADVPTSVRLTFTLPPTTR